MPDVMPVQPLPQIADVVEVPVLPPRIPRLVYLNAPSGAGKITLTNHLLKLPGVASYHSASPLWDMANEFRSKLNPFATDLDFNDQSSKQIKLTDLSAHTWRDFLIHQGNYVRQAFGPGVLGSIAREQCLSYLNEEGFDSVVLPAIRTKEDMQTLTDLVPLRQQVLIRIEREGCSWEGDIGNYLSPEIPSITLSNNDTIDEFLRTATAFLIES